MSRETSKVWLLKITILFILVGLIGLLLESIPMVSVRAAQPPASPTPTLVPQEPSSTTKSDKPLIQAPPLLEATVEDIQQTQSPPQVLEIISVPANENGVTSSTILNQDVVYTIRVTGVFVWGGCDPIHCPGGGPEYVRWGDAVRLTDDHFHGSSDPFWSGVIYLEVNGSRPDFGPYNSDHTYSIHVVGNDQQATFRIQDCSFCYPDNAGALTAEIIEGVDTGSPILVSHIKPFLQRSIPAGDADWGDEQYGDLNITNSSDKICGWGCFLTSWAMIIDHYGFGQNFHTNPRGLNEWLQNEDGYSGRLVIPLKVAEYANEKLEESGAPFRLKHRVRGRNNLELDVLLDADVPVILKVKVPRPCRPEETPPCFGDHFPLAFGRTTSVQETPTWYLYDPGGCEVGRFWSVPTLQTGYDNLYIRRDWLEPVDPDTLQSLIFILASPAELLVTDPQGRRTGIDPRTGITYDEIPEGFYDVDEYASRNGQAGEFPPRRIFNLSEPLDGSYTIEVVGTGSGEYSFDTLTYDQVGDPSSAKISGQVNIGSIDTYRMDYSSTPGAQVNIQRIVQVDIKPGSDPNSIICTNEEEVITVAILTTDDFDALTVDHTTVTFEEAGETHVDRRSGEPRRHEEDVDGDGDIDLVFHFRLGDTSLTCDSTEGILTGETVDGLSIEGTDAVHMINQDSGQPSMP